MKKYLIAGNWKMNMVPSQAKEFAKQLTSIIKTAEEGVEVMIAPPFTALSKVNKVLDGSIIKLGAQNLNENEKGAFTGEISAEMLLDVGVTYVIIGHSERRHIYKESDDLINKKMIFALSKKLKPILCVGELLEEREAGRTESVVKNQVINGLKGIPEQDLASVVIAYEPVWAIGTGKVATPEMAQEVHALIRNTLKGLYSEKAAENMIIQYGGSVNAENVKGLMSQKDINGALVGGASLKADSFASIVNFNK